MQSFEQIFVKSLSVKCFRQKNEVIIFNSRISRRMKRVDFNTFQGNKGGKIIVLKVG